MCVYIVFLIKQLFTVLIVVVKMLFQLEKKKYKIDYGMFRLVGFSRIV